MGSPKTDVYSVFPTTPKAQSPQLRDDDALPFSARVNPLHTASWVSVLWMQWFQPLVTLGNRKILEQDDLWPVCPTDTCAALHARFIQCYDMQSRTTSSSRFGRALAKTFQRDILLVFMNHMLYTIAMVLQPYFAQAILDFLADRDTIFHVSNGYVLVALLTLVSIGGIMAINYGFFSSSRIGVNLRSVIMDVVYQKALRLSCVARQQYTTGEIITLMSVDAERIFRLMISGPWLVIGPVTFVLTIVLVGSTLDVVAAMSGGVLLVVIFYLSLQLAKRIGALQGQLLRVVDERVKVTSEALQGIRVMKFYAWEESLALRVEKIRSREVQLYRRFHFLNTLNTALLFLTPVLLGAVFFGVVVLHKGTISIPDAFMLIAMVNISRQAVNHFPKAIAAISQARIAFRRMDAYMESDEVASIHITSDHKNDPKGSILIHSGTFVWSETANVVVEKIHTSDATAIVTLDEPKGLHHNFVLEGINVEIEAGSLVMIVGSVGSGKTSLLHAILGEMVHKSGSCGVNGEIAYVSQEAWIRNASVRENILFEADFDHDKYTKVVGATQLTLDLDALPNGDETEIGERGINLSGGQKARVAIARAMYRPNYDILILDDPLSAVDPHIAHAIFDKCIDSLARDKTRLLVLNSHYDLLTRADKILVIDHGRIVGNGSYRDILAQFPDLDVRKHQLEEAVADVINDHPPLDGNTKQLAVAAAVEPSSAGESKPSTNDRDHTPNKKLVQKEDRVKGRVTGQTYRAYFDETGFNGIIVIMLVIVVYAIAQALRIAADYWQGYWAKQMPRKGVDASYTDAYYAHWYVVFVVTCIVLTLARGLFLMEVCLRSARNLHNQLFRRVLAAPVNLYFDVTPVGRILNRFSNDLDQVDATLLEEYQNMFQILVVIFGSLVVCALASFWIAISFIPMFIVSAMTGVYFKRTSREIKRLEGISRTPVFNLFGETLHGLHTIRAFKMEDTFQRLNRSVVDNNASCYFAFWAAGRWLAVRLDAISILIITIVSLYIVASKHSITPVVAGISITYSLMLTSMVQLAVRAVDTTDNAMTSVERLLHFRTIPTEEDTNKNRTPINSAVWPTVGSIKFNALCLKYRPELPLVLKGVDLDIRGGEMVGICGRTGAGKSSLMIALFRICEYASGSVWIDGVDISTLTLLDLRRSLAIIPQDPVLYSGALRENLDPFHEYSDDAIWNVLRQVHLSDTITKWGHGLDFVVSERGDNLSVGQRQLLCIGRALLKNNKIVVLDEATANVDMATDNVIQETIRETFQHRTVLIIAHRIHTILHCDKIAVMDNGSVAEFGPPTELLERTNSLFASLANKRAPQQ